MFTRRDREDARRSHRMSAAHDRACRLQRAFERTLAERPGEELGLLAWAYQCGFEAEPAIEDLCA